MYASGRQHIEYADTLYTHTHTYKYTYYVGCRRRAVAAARARVLCLCCNCVYGGRFVLAGELAWHLETLA